MKTAVILTGGGANAAFQVGALEFLTKRLEMEWDIYLGISAGALNAVMAAQGDVDRLVDIWSGLDSHRKIYRKPPLSYAVYLRRYWKYNNSPLRDLIRENVDVERLNARGRVVRVCATCWDTGEPRWFGPEEDGFLDAVIASTSIPFYFKMRQIGNNRYFDGGLTTAVAVDDALKLGAEKIVLILASPRCLPREMSPIVSAHLMGERTIEIMLHQLRETRLSLHGKMEERGDLVVIAPERKFSRTIKFSRDHIFEAMEHGWTEAREKWLYQKL